MPRKNNKSAVNNKKNQNNNNNKKKESKKRSRPVVEDEEIEQQQENKKVKTVEKEEPTITTTSVANTEFSWSAFNSLIDKEDKNEATNESDDEEDEDNTVTKTSAASRAQKQRLNEKLISEREKELVSDDILPETDADFERLLAGSPNSSYLWIQYMVFKLANGDVDTARKVAERALKKINYREEQEKFNIYATLMNLESKFGTEETQRKIFSRAVQSCEAKDIYLQQAKIYEQNEEHDRVKDTFQKMMKKFHQSRKPYEAYQLYLISNGKQYKRANEILERALKNLPKKKHLKILSKFAVIHYKFGSIIDGHQIFEQLVANYPNRTDLWSMYIDTELASKRYDQVRQLYERVVTLNLSTKKMQSYLKRYLKFEKEYGTEEGQENVKQLARDYIARKTHKN
jgi:rRNA biogenesis protein RRP5